MANTQIAAYIINVPVFVSHFSTDKNVKDTIKLDNQLTAQHNETPGARQEFGKISAVIM